VAMSNALSGVIRFVKVEVDIKERVSKHLVANKLNDGGFEFYDSEEIFKLKCRIVFPALNNFLWLYGYQYKKLSL
jgi:hypothetical protein